MIKGVATISGWFDDFGGKCCVHFSTNKNGEQSPQVEILMRIEFLDDMYMNLINEVLTYKVKLTMIRSYCGRDTITREFEGILLEVVNTKE